MTVSDALSSLEIVDAAIRDAYKALHHIGLIYRRVLRVQASDDLLTLCDIRNPVLDRSKAHLISRLLQKSHRELEIVFGRLLISQRRQDPDRLVAGVHGAWRSPAASQHAARLDRAPAKCLRAPLVTVLDGNSPEVHGSARALSRLMNATTFR